MCILYHNRGIKSTVFVYFHVLSYPTQGFRSAKSAPLFRLAENSTDHDGALLSFRGARNRVFCNKYCSYEALPCSNRYLFCAGTVCIASEKEAAKDLADCKEYVTFQRKKDGEFDILRPF